MKAFLVQFTHEVWCGHREIVSAYLLVYASSFKDACDRIIQSGRYDDVEDFKDLTL